MMICRSANAAIHRCQVVPILVTMIIGLFGVPLVLLAEDTILWVNDDLPPAFISEGPDRGQGIIDGAIKIYQKHLPEYQHKHIIANMVRILDFMRKGEKVCYAGFLKTPQREKYIYFSIPNIINYNNAIVVLKERQTELFGQHKEASLQGLLENGQWMLGITQDRSYGQIIDHILKKYGLQGNNILMRSGTDSLMGLMAMAAQRRIDFTIGFPWEVPYVARQLGMQRAFNIIPIKETAGSRWILNYIGCPKTQWGRQLIDKINSILITVRPTEEHMQHQLKWFPQSMEADIRRAYKEKILSVIP